MRPRALRRRYGHIAGAIRWSHPAGQPKSTQRGQGARTTYLIRAGGGRMWHLFTITDGRPERLGGSQYSVADAKRLAETHNSRIE
jgi:hypothetical protein